MSLSAGSCESSGSLRSESLIEMLLVEHLPTEELDSGSPLVLWPNFDADNIVFYRCRRIGLWTEEEDRLLSRVLCVSLGNAEMLLSM